MGGYQLIYKNCILSAGWLFRQVSLFGRREAESRTEKWLFVSHPFLGSVLAVGILAVPWLVCFFPGTVEPDAGSQLYMAFDIAELTAHHPVVVTKVMGFFVSVGRSVFGSDCMGIFLYTFCQFAIQTLTVAYAIYVMGCMRTPLWLRWAALAFYGIYPIFPIWGYTMVKDSAYYISVLLFAAALAHILTGDKICRRFIASAGCASEGMADGSGRRDILHKKKTGLEWWKISLLAVSASGICMLRKEGWLVVLSTLIFGAVVCRAYRRLFGCVMAMCLCLVLTNKVYLEVKDIKPSPVKEALSVPLQQTARYIKEYYYDIRPEEMEVLQGLFSVDIAEIAEVYDAELSDPVKEVFILYPEEDEVKSYFDIWSRQFLRHPDVYVQAFLNHMYGYICPEKKESWKGEDIGVFKINLNRAVFDVEFGIESSTGRDILEEYARTTRQLPVLGMLYSPGIYTWIIMGCMLYLTEKRKWKEMTVYIPGCFILLICMLSPVNACIRYMLPVMAVLPIYLALLCRMEDSV